MAPPPNDNPDDDDDSVTIVDGVLPSPCRNDKLGAPSEPQPEGSPRSIGSSSDELSMAQSNILIAPTPELPRKQHRDRATDLENSSSPPSSEPLFSPATQTLNALSQNMDDLRYNMEAAANRRHPELKPAPPESLPDSEPEVQGVFNTGKSKTSAAKASGKGATAGSSSWIATESSSWSTSRTPPLPLAPRLPDPKNCLMPDVWKHRYHDIYEWIPVHVKGNTTVTGKGVGMVIQRDQFYAPHTSGPSAHHRQVGLTHCKILRLVPGGSAEASGIRVDDWMCRPVDENPAAPILAQFEEVQAWAKTRCFRASVLRRKNSPNDATTITKPKPKTLQKIAPIESQATVPFLSGGKPPQGAAMAAAVDGETAALDKSRQDSLPLKKRWNRKANTTVDTSKATKVAKVSSDAKRRKPKAPSSTQKDGHSSKKVTTPPQDTTKNKPKSDSYALLPFCRLCQHLKKHGKRGHDHRKPRSHHAWCPHNPFFDNSGGQALLDRIQQGRNQLHCVGCEKEYESGKLEPAKAHSQMCLQNQKRLKKLIQEKEDEEERKEKAEKEKKKSRKEQDRKKMKRLLLLSSSEEEDEGPSEIQSRRKRQRTVDPSDRKVKASTAVSNGGKPTKKSEVQSPKTQSTTRKVSSEEGSRRVTPPPTEARKETAARKEVSTTTRVPTTTVASKNQQHQTTTHKSCWESTMENPWGPHGHQQGDIMMYGPHRGMGHYETLLPSRRYILHPFAAHSNYCTTHCTPQEGFTVLCLQRDPSARQPWGFGVIRDDFGNACLVEHVQPMTAASAATAVGSEDIVGLKVHDMVVMINGHCVGGMTEVGLDLELETSGPRLILVISRYKHARAAAQQLAAMERNMLRVMDKACRDERLLGWQEVGNAAVQPPNASGVPTLGGSDDPQQMVTEDTQDERDGMNIDKPSLLDTSKLNASQEEENGDSDGEERPDHIDDEEASSPHSSLLQSCVLEREVVKVNSEKGNPYSSGSDESVGGNNGSDNGEWEEDQNAWNGCVCGEIHEKGTRVFWIQCEDCDSWYDVSEKCVGFTEKQAKKIKTWTCWACGCESSSSPSPSPRKVMPSQPSSVARRLDDKLKEKEERIVPSHKSEPQPSMIVKHTSPDSPNVPTSLEFCQTSDSQGGASLKTDDEIPDSLVVQYGDLEQLKAVSESENPVRKPTKKKIRNRKLVKNDDGCLISNCELKQRDDGTFRRPYGPSPSGFTLWDEVRGVWAPDGKPPVSEQAVAGNSQDRGQPKQHKNGNVDSSREPEIDKSRRKNVETDDGFLISNAKVRKRDDGTFQRPHGPSPHGFIWDDRRGLWAPEGNLPSAASQKTVAGNSQGSGRSKRKVGSWNSKKGDVDNASYRVNVLESSEESKKPSARKERLSGTGDVHLVFGKGDLVYVEQHAWPGWNVEEGIGNVTHSYVDQEGDRFYNVKYAIGGSVKGISAEFIRSYSFG